MMKSGRHFESRAVLSLLIVMAVGCNKPVEKPPESDKRDARISQLSRQVEELKSAESSLKAEIQTLTTFKDNLAARLKECETTDQGMWTQAMDLMTANKPVEALSILDAIVEKFPETSIRKQIVKKKKDIVSEERSRWKDLLKSLSVMEIEGEMNAVNAYLSGSLLEEQRTDGAEKLAELQKEFEETKREREIEKQTGARIQVAETGWKWVQCDNEFMGPYIKLKITNTRTEEIALKISADFYKGDESIGHAEEDIGSLFAPSLKPGKFQTMEIFPCWGSETDLVVLSLPNIKADLKINGMDFKSVKVTKKATGYPVF